jgi:predicted dehydrogenase
LYLISGGGCLIDLGVHLVGLALSTLEFPPLAGDFRSALFAGGKRLDPGSRAVEDFAYGSFDLAGGQAVRLACSRGLHTGCDARISASFHGSRGGAALRHLDGSFYDFVAELYRGTQKEVLSLPPDDWGGRAAADWAMGLARGERFDAASENLVRVAGVLDRLYAAA